MDQNVSLMDLNGIKGLKINMFQSIADIKLLLYFCNQI